MKPNEPNRYVYVAGPMSRGNLLEHVRNAIQAGDQIIRAGGIPYLPQVQILWEIASPKAYEHWMELDFAWIERVDCLIRLPGESPGADREVEHARKIGKPVFFGVDVWLNAVGFEPKREIEPGERGCCRNCNGVGLIDGDECAGCDGSGMPLQ